MKHNDTYRTTSGSMDSVGNIARFRRAIDITGDYPLEVGLCVWAGSIGLVTAFFDPPSSSLEALPHSLDLAWALTMVIAAGTTIYGLWTRNVGPAIANAMFLFASAFTAYSITVSVVGGWRTSGAVAGLTAVLAIVCYVRSRRLRQLWKILIEESSHDNPTS